MSHVVLALTLAASVAAASTHSDPPARGRLVQVGTRHLNVYCTGKGSPTVVVETGFGDFSFDWALVQRLVAAKTRVCTYDRGGYAWSELGPEPRTYDQLNLELHMALAAANEAPPFVLVGHSFGGGPVRNYALRYGSEVGGLVLADAVGDTEYISMGREAQQLKTFAKGRPIPDASVSGEMRSDTPTAPSAAAEPEPLPSAYRALPPALRELHLWASARPSLEAAESGMRDWSPEYFARWSARSQAGVLGSLPLLVMARRVGGYDDGLNVPAATLESARLEAQRALAAWSEAGELRLVDSGHDMHLEHPDLVADAIGTIVDRVRRGAAGSPAKEPTGASGTGAH